jgi:hypothetical protein
MLTYSQSTGEFRAGTGQLVGIGFSGFEHMKNRGEFENVLHGPIPKMAWRVFPPRPRPGNSWRMRLEPSKPVDRTSHGTFSIQAGDTSFGCINLPPQALLTVVDLVNKGERVLEVIP